MQGKHDALKELKVSRIEYYRPYGFIGQYYVTIYLFLEKGETAQISNTPAQIAVRLYSIVLSAAL